MKTTIPGKLRNIQVSRERPLLPLFEAVINSFQAIAEARKVGLAAGQIKIKVLRAPSLIAEMQGRIDGFEVWDDGIGFDDTNHASFCTADSLHKHAIGGKGVGRFSWLKVFLGARVRSVYPNGSGMILRQFKFDSQNEPDECEITHGVPDARGTHVVMQGLRSEYEPTMPREGEEIAFCIVEHCAPMLLRQDAPLIQLIDGEESHDLNRLFDSYRKDRAQEGELSLFGAQFRVTLFRSESGTHRINFAAHGRSVQTRKLAQYMPGLPQRLGGADPFVINCYVEGVALDDTVDAARSSFDLPSSAMDRNSTLFKFPTMEELTGSVVDKIRELCQPELEEIDRSKREQIVRFISDERPEYRAIINDFDVVLDQVPLNASNKKLDQILGHHVADVRNIRRERTEKALREVEQSDPNSEESNSAVEELLKNVTAEEKATLAQHVANRMLVIRLFEKSLTAEPGTRKYPAEKILHKLIFPMKSTSDDADLEQNHLWMIDERLSYHTFLASDKPLRTIANLESSSELRPDIVVFDTAWVLSESRENPIGSLTVIEFKKAMRDDYNDNENPISQVYEQLHALRQGTVRRQDGRPINLNTGEIQCYAYIVCDLTPKLHKWAQFAALKKTPDGQGYFGYNEAVNTYIEIISFDKLVRDAKKRNRILFAKLGIEGHE